MLSLQQFYRDKSASSGRQPYCIDCKLAYKYTEHERGDGASHLRRPGPQNVSKKVHAFVKRYGFFPSQEKCARCDGTRADHNEQMLTSSEDHDFAPTGVSA